MPARFHFVSPGVWDRRFRELSCEGKVVAFLVWTGRTRLSEGLFELSPGHVAADTGLSVDQALAALQEIGAAGLADYDPDAEVVLDRQALRTNPLRNGLNKETGEVQRDRRIKPAVQRFEQLPDTPLKATFLELADLHSPDLANAIREDLGLPVPAPPQAPTQGPWHGPTQGPTQGPSREESSRGEQIRGEARTGNACEVCGDEPCSCSPTIKMRAQLAAARDSYERQTGERLGAA